MIKHLQQPDDSKVCGQTVVAMAAGVAVDEVIKVIGPDHGTKTGDLRYAFGKYGIKTVGKTLMRWNGKDKPPDYALLHMVFHKKGEKFHGHWQLNWEGVIHDPGFKAPEFYSANGRLTAYLELVPPDRDIMKGA